jgi:hypothetical protein
VRIGVVGLEGDCLAIFGNRRLELPSTLQGCRQIVAQLRISRIERRGLADQLGRRIEASRVSADDAEIKERADLTLIDRQDVAVARFRLGKLSGLVMTDRGRQQRGDLAAGPPARRPPFLAIHHAAFRWLKARW